MKWIVGILLPAIGTLYFALAGSWNLPRPEDVIGTLAAVATFLGVITGISSLNYNNSDKKYSGTLNVDTSDPTKDVYSLDVGSNLETLATQKQIILRVGDLPKRAEITTP